MKIDKLNDRMLLMIMVIFSLLVLLLPHLLRDSPYMINSESHDIIRSAELLNSGEYYDHLKGTLLDFDLYTYLIAGLMPIFPKLIIAKVLPILLGLLCSAYFYLTLRAINLSKTKSVLASVLLAVSPAYVYLFFSLNYYSLIVVLAITAVYFFIINKHTISSAFFALLLIASPFAFVLLATVIWPLKKNFLRTLRLYASATIAAIIILVSVIISTPFTYLTNYSFSHSLVDFGAAFGMNIPMILLFLIGFISLWKKINIHHRIIIGILFLLSLFNPLIMLLSGFVMAFFAASAIYLLFNRRWELKNIKNIALLLVICTILFSSLSYISRLADNPPSPELVRAIQNIPQSNQKVLTHASYESFIHYYAKRKTIVPSNESPEASEIFQSRNLKLTESLLVNSSTDTFFITSDMKLGLVWHKDEQGLAFLLENSEKFVNRYRFLGDDYSYEVWVYEPKESLP
ncbi:MAG: glycosyltransferase family 39 protein [Nanoarchaeota archaeon]|nr:glycosyltransferase family 39 protein [Nanoarchaeota archaeon]